VVNFRVSDWLDNIQNQKAWLSTLVYEASNLVACALDDPSRERNIQPSHYDRFEVMTFFRRVPDQLLLASLKEHVSTTCMTEPLILLENWASIPIGLHFS
jgi:hypothetical protein